MERLDIIDCPIEPPEPKDVQIPYEILIGILVEELDMVIEEFVQ